MVPLRWRDLDHQGHVFHASMLTLLDEARTEWLKSALGCGTPDSYVVVRIEIDYRAQLRREDGTVTVAFGVVSAGETSLTLREEVRAGRSGFLVAESTTTIVMWDRDAESGRRLNSGERERAVQCMVSVQDR